jgi:hypothetical protein
VSRVRENRTHGSTGGGRKRNANSVTAPAPDPTRLLGTLAFVTAMLRTREVPTAPLILYAVGAVPVSLRGFVPEAVLDARLAVLAVGIAWLAIWLFGRSDRIATWPIAGTPPAHRVAA